MSEETINQVVQILLPVLATFLTAVFTYLGNKIRTSYQQKSNQQVTEQVIQNVVKYVEQVYVDIKGPEKLQKAIEQASTILQEKGIKITDAEIYMLIESAVYGLNEGLKPKKELVEVNEEVKQDITEDIKEEEPDIIEE